METLSLKLVDTGNKLTKSRKTIVESSLKTILDAFYVRKPKNSFKLEPKNMMMTAFYGYSLTFYRVLNNEKLWTTWNLFPELISAVKNGIVDRDFKAEIRNSYYNYPIADYEPSHINLLTQYESIQTEKASERAAQIALNEKHSREKMERKSKDLKIKQDLMANADPAELEAIRQVNLDGKKRAIQCFDNGAVEAGSENTDSSTDSDNNENRDPHTHKNNSSKDNGKKRKKKKDRKSKTHEQTFSGLEEVPTSKHTHTEEIAVKTTANPNKRCSGDIDERDQNMSKKVSKIEVKITTPVIERKKQSKSISEGREKSKTTAGI
jgi:hypothetical protein